MATTPNVQALPFMSQANAVGQGFNVYGTLDESSLITPLFDFAAAGDQEFTFLGKQYRIPTIVNGIENTKTYYTGGTFDTRDSFQNSIAVHANVSASYGAFSGEMETAFSREYQQESEYSYSYNTLFAPLAILQLIPNSTYLSPAFTDRVNQLPPTLDASTLPDFEDFFNSFGVYFTSKIFIGASLEFWVATEKSSTLTDDQISACLKAQYDALYVSGSLSADFKASAQWKSYSASSNVNVQAIGADPTKAAALAALDPFSPSSATVNAYTTWVDSIATDPAIMDFGLTGIWELCGPRTKVVQEAWDAYGTQMRPNLMIVTSTSLYPPTPAVLPAITLGQSLTPTTPPQGNVGYQVVVLNGNDDITAPDAVIFNRYYGIPGSDWWDAYRAMYDEMAADLTNNQLTASGNVLILAGFNLNWNAAPTQNFINVLRNAGGGAQLTYWLNNNDNGSTLGYAGNVVLVGIFGQGIGSDAEFIKQYLGNGPFPVQMQVLFYRKTDGSGYTLGVGDVG